MHYQLNQPIRSRALCELMEIDPVDVDVTGLTVDSRQVQPGFLFIGLQTEQGHGSDYCLQAIESGASLVFIETQRKQSHGQVRPLNGVLIIDVFQLSSYLGQLARMIYDDPSAAVNLISVTGTNGKTSISHIYGQMASLVADHCLVSGTLGLTAYRNGTEVHLQDLPNTTMDAAQLHATCYRAVRESVGQVAIEASSHGLAQWRLSELSVDIAIFSNLSHDHLDYHQTFENYARCKRQLISQRGVKWLVVNANDAEAKNWLADKHADQQAVIYGVQDDEAENLNAECYCLATYVRHASSGLCFQIDSSWGKGECYLSLIGDFNIHNFLAAFSALLVQGYAFDTLLNHALDVSGIPGRMELFPFYNYANVIVDYAHTPDALEQALISARQHTMGNLICLFGCGGERDLSKRALMGKIAETWADTVFITEDNSRSEDVMNIISHITSGMSSMEKVVIEPDRRKAVRAALAQSSAFDVLLLAGKGHEKNLIRASGTEPYDERAFVAEIESEFIR